MLEKIAGKKIQAQYDPPRPGDILHSQADISLARKLLGYQPLVNFEEGLKRTWAWYQSAYGKYFSQEIISFVGAQAAAGLASNRKRPVLKSDVYFSICVIYNACLTSQTRCLCES